MYYLIMLTKISKSWLYFYDQSFSISLLYGMEKKRLPQLEFFRFFKLYLGAIIIHNLIVYTFIYSDCKIISSKIKWQ